MKLCLCASSLGLMAGFGDEEASSNDVDSPELDSMLTVSVELGPLLDAEALKVCQAWAIWEARAV